MEKNMKHFLGLMVLVCVSAFAKKTYTTKKYNEDFSTGLKVSTQDWKKTATFYTPVVNRARLPRHFDWRLEVSHFPKVKHQGSCGSCWAFGAVSVLEAVVQIRERKTASFSEQQLVSCNTTGDNCIGGWPATAHQLHQDFGAVLEKDYPYTATDSPCQTGINFDTKIANWAYVHGQKFSSASNDELKTVILENGPIVVDITSNADFKTYASGIYNTCVSNPHLSNGNHIVVIVGWDDTDQYWIIRNSWGEKWGEQGYMRIKYNCNDIAKMASFIKDLS